MMMTTKQQPCSSDNAILLHHQHQQQQQQRRQRQCFNGKTQSKPDGMEICSMFTIGGGELDFQSNLRTWFILLLAQKKPNIAIKSTITACVSPFSVDFGPQ
jgi:hypothetical protein